MLKKIRNHKASVWAFGLTAIILGMVQWKVEKPMILIERFIPYSGWAMVLVLSSYAAFLVHKMSDPAQSAIWRKRSWSLFSFIFFAQLILGLSGFEKFLMNPEKLHFPIPALIVAGPLYRGHISFMTILFISTVVLAGPAWCSQLCYFGAIDNVLASRGKPLRNAIKYRSLLKNVFLLLVVVSAILFRIFQLDVRVASAFAVLFGLAGIMIIFVVSANTNKMFHCSVYCPVGTLIRYIKYINPFRMYIDTNCTECMLCTSTCRYDALNAEDIKNKKPGATCTLCGDCISSCHSFSIKYKFLNLSPVQARNLWLIITITLHAVFLGLARL